MFRLKEILNWKIILRIEINRGTQKSIHSTQIVFGTFLQQKCVLFEGKKI